MTGFTVDTKLFQELGELLVADRARHPARSGAAFELRLREVHGP